MNNDTFGSRLCILMGVLIPLSAIVFLLIDVLNMKQPIFFILAYGLLGVGNLCGLGIVAAVFLIFGDEKGVLIGWANSLGYLGFAIGTIDSVRTIEFASGLVSWPEQLPRIIARTDPLGILSFGGVGVWMLIVNWIALRNNLLPKRLAWAGLILGFASFSPAISEALQNITFFAVITILFISFVPIWYIGMGLHLRSLALKG